MGWVELKRVENSGQVYQKFDRGVRLIMVKNISQRLAKMKILFLQFPDRVLLSPWQAERDGDHDVQVVNGTFE